MTVDCPGRWFVRTESRACRAARSGQLGYRLGAAILRWVRTKRSLRIEILTALRIDLAMVKIGTDSRAAAARCLVNLWLSEQRTLGAPRCRR